MSDTPQVDPRGREGAARDEDVERAEELERVHLSPDDQPNAPNRDPEPERAGPNADPDQVPGPLEPGENDPERSQRVQSYEQPGVRGNWADDDLED